jgi:drug/metabolite transporter (DMT)-like permease
MIDTKLTGGVRNAAHLVVAAAGVGVTFVLSTVVMDQVPDSVLVAVVTLIAAVMGLVLLGVKDAVAAARSSREDLVRAAAGGVAALWAAPFLVLIQRASDAPSGAVVLFHTTALWGVILAGVWWIESARVQKWLSRGTAEESAPLASAVRATWLAPVAAVASAVGSAGVLANWERPSSFSPFIKYPAQEVLMLVAGLVFVAGSLLIVRSLRSLAPRTAALAALVAAAATAAIVALPAAAGSLGSLQRLSAEFVLLGVGAFALAWGWVGAISAFGVARSSAVFLVAPALLTLLSVLERATGVYGPNPILWQGAITGAALCVTGAGTVLAARTTTPPRPELGTEGAAEKPAPAFFATVPAFMMLKTARVLGAVAAVAALAGMFLPALRATSVGSMPVPFQATWAMRGFECASPWVAFAGAAVAVAASLLAPTKLSRPALVLALLTVAAAAFAYPMLLDTPLHTWNNWIPSDVQQTYGTEYALFTVEVITNLASMVAIVAAAAGATALLASAVLRATPVEDH